jgi:DNA-directed RNA polymerase specialized sigma24 family protein
MPLSRGEEMTGQIHSQISVNGDSRYATREDFLKIFDEDISDLYQLSFLLTGNHQKGERCFVSGIEQCAKENRVFREWARAWARRVIAKNAIRELRPRRKDSRSFSVPTVFSHNQQSGCLVGHFDVDSVLGLADFERFVFVLCVLEHYREHECALLLGCPASEVRDARTRAMAELASICQVVPVGATTVSAVGWQKHPRHERGHK